MSLTWNQANPEKKRLNDARFFALHPEYSRVYRWKRRGINCTVPQYNELLDKQNGVCAVCGRKDPLRSLAVDHDHVTGKIRGLLCTTCNRLVVSVVDRFPDLIRIAQSYVRGAL